MIKYIKLKKDEDKLKKWLNDNHLKESILKKTYVYYKKMRKDCKQKLTGELISGLEDYKLKNKIISCLLTGYFFNIGYKIDNKYNTDKVKNVKITKESWVKDKKKIMYTELFTVNNTSYMQLCSNISKKTMNLYNYINSFI
jgi:hypothetical protein